MANTPGRSLAAGETGTEPIPSEPTGHTSSSTSDTTTTGSLTFGTSSDATTTDAGESSSSPTSSDTESQGLPYGGPCRHPEPSIDVQPAILRGHESVQVAEAPLASGSTESTGSMGATAGTGAGDSEGGSTSGDEADGHDPDQLCEAFAERCGQQLPFLCDDIEQGLQAPESCAPVASEYLQCLDELRCKEADEGHFACADEFEAAHEACPSVLGFCRSRVTSLDKLQFDPESCESQSQGCIDGSEYALICEPDSGTTTCSCFVDFESVGSFDTPQDAPANFCHGQDADDLSVEPCGWAPGIVPPLREG